jgi:hypothetical protein
MAFRKISLIHWFQNMGAPGSNPSAGAYMYGEGDQIKVRQANGTTFALAPSGGSDTAIAYAFFMA